MTLEDYLSGKKIDPTLFQASEPARWEEFKASFEGVHPNSFTAQKKFLLNDLRRRYLLRVPDVKPLEKPVDTAPMATSGTTPAVPAEAKPVRPVVKRPAAIIRKPTEES